MYQTLSFDDSLSDTESSFFPELEEGYHDSFYDEFDEDLVFGSLPLLTDDKYSYLEKVYGNSDGEGDDLHEDVDETDGVDVESEITEDMDVTIERLSQEMENEKALAQVRQEVNDGLCSNSDQDELSMVRTKSGRVASVIMEGCDEEESVGLLQYASGQEEFRRSQSYQVGFESKNKSKPAFPWLQAAPTFKMDKFGNFVLAESIVESPVKAQKTAMFSPIDSVTRQPTGHGNGARKGVQFAAHVEIQKSRRTSNAVRFEEQTRFECAEPIQRQTTKHSNAHKKRARFNVEDTSAPPAKIQRQVTKHSSALSRPCHIRFGSGTKTCRGEAIQRQATKHVRVLF